MAGRIDAALVTFALEQGRGPRYIKMSSGTWAAWRPLRWWAYRDIAIKFANLEFGEVECV